MITRLVMWWLHRQYIKFGMPIFYIKGNDKDMYKYLLLYTEDKNVYKKWSAFSTQNEVSE